MMKRWNGWGYTNVNMHLDDKGAEFLKARIGAGNPQPDAKLEEVVKRVPASRLPAHALVKTDAVERIQHSAGQSLGDWVAMRSGHYPAFADGVAYPTSTEEVRQLMHYARESGVQLIPYGGGTSVVGHLTPHAQLPTLMLDMSRMNKLLALDEQSQLATFEAGVAGPDLEAALQARGYTLGHYPQSFEFSTLGGWVATRSSGQQSRHFGRIEQMFAGGRVETYLGTLDLPSFPASAAGPDVREMVLGSEGRLGVITQATVRVQKLPQSETFEGVFFPTYAQALLAVRAIAQANLPLSMMRLSNMVETKTNLMLAAHWALGLLERYLKMRGADEDKCMLVFALTGNKRVCQAARRELVEIVQAHNGVVVGALLGKTWRNNRFRGAYLRNTMWDKGYAVDTLETAVNWQNTEAMVKGIEGAIQAEMAAHNAGVHIFTHLSHVYPTGSSVYTTYAFRLGDTPEETLARWQKVKAAASLAIGANGGTISHQHGVGTDHAPYLAAEKGAVGMQALQALVKTFDPSGTLNAGKLIGS